MASRMICCIESYGTNASSFGTSFFLKFSLFRVFTGGFLMLRPRQYYHGAWSTAFRRIMHLANCSPRLPLLRSQQARLVLLLPPPTDGTSASGAETNAGVAFSSFSMM